MKEQVWWTAPAEVPETGMTVMVTVRADAPMAPNAKKMKMMIEVRMPYDGLPSGMPDDATTEIIDQVTHLLSDTFAKDPVAMPVTMVTGNNERVWFFYTLSPNIFQRKFNEALADLPLLPLEFSMTEDPDWSVWHEAASYEVKVD